MRVARLASALLLASIACGCRSVPEVPGDLPAEQAYQTIANQLPRADFGWGEPPGSARYAASERATRSAEPPKPPEVSCNERGVKLVVEVFKPRLFSFKYAAIEAVEYGWCPFPNVINCFVFPFFQVCEARVVFDASKVDDLIPHIEGECERLEAISREIGLGGPWGYAQGVRSKLADDAARYGPGRISVAFSYASPVPPYFPVTGRARRTAEAFAWAKAHPSEPELAPRPLK